MSSVQRKSGEVVDEVDLVDVVSATLGSIATFLTIAIKNGRQLVLRTEAGLPS
jgi:hypothetical protein